MKNGHVVHLIVGRSAAVPDELRWYVRYVWWSHGKGAHDRVVAEGRINGVEPHALPRECALLALEEATRRLRALDPPQPQ